MISSQGACATNKLEELSKQVMITHNIDHCLNLVMKKYIQDFPAVILSMTQKVCQSFNKSTIKKWPNLKPLWRKEIPSCLD